jgi:hypothetical protein
MMTWHEKQVIHIGTIFIHISGFKISKELVLIIFYT